MIIRWMMVVLLLMAGSALAQEQFRRFQVGERTIEARVLNVDAKRGTVELELRNKQRKKVKSSIFNEEDQSYIREFALTQAFKSQRFKIEVDKNILDKRKEMVGPQKAIIRNTETICYDINISNNTDTTIDGVTIAYNVFYEQEELGRGKNDTRRLFVDGSLKIKPLAPHQKVLVQTAKIEVYNQRLGGGYDEYVGGAPSHQSGKSKGVWLKIHLKTPSGLSATREVCLPKNTNELFAWQRSEK